MNSDETLIDLINNVLPEAERQKMIAGLAGSKVLRDDLSVLIKMEHGIKLNKEDIAEPEEVSAALFNKLGYNAIPAVPEGNVPASRFNLSVVLSLASSLILLVTVLLFVEINKDTVPNQKFINHLAAGFENTANTIGNKIIAQKSSVKPETKNDFAADRNTIPPKKKKYIASGINPGQDKTNSGNGVDSAGLTVLVPDDTNTVPSNEPEFTEIELKDNMIDNSIPVEIAIPDNLPVLSISEEQPAIKGESIIDDFSLEFGLSQGYYINTSGIKGTAFAPYENTAFTIYYDFSRFFSLGLSFSRDIFRIDNVDYRPDSYGIAMSFSGQESAGFAPAGNIFIGVNEPGALLKINTGVSYRASPNISLFLGLGFQDFFHLSNNFKDSKKIGLVFSIKYSF